MTDQTKTTEAADEPEIERLADDEAFKHDVSRILKEAEELRIGHMRRYRNRGFIAMTLGLTIVCAGACGFGWFLIMHGDIQKAVASIALSVIIPILLYLWHDNPIGSYNKAFKNIIMPEIARALGGLRFNPNRGINEKILSKTGILPAYDDYKAEDCFYGRYKNVKVMFSEAQLNVKIHADPVFRGVFVLLEAPQKIFDGHTVITSDDRMAAEWSKTRWKNFSRTPLPDKSEYDSDFFAYSDNPQHAQKILTHDLLKELFEAGKIFEQAPITAAFFRSKYIFIAIPCVRDMFEASTLHVPVSTREHAMSCKREIEQILEIIDIVDLFQNKP